MSGWAMAQFLDGFDVNGSSLKPFLLQNSERVKDHAIAMAKKYERPFQYLSSAIRKEDNARELAEHDGMRGVSVYFSIRTLPYLLLPFPEGGPLSSPLGASVCISISTSWTATSVSSMCVFRLGFPCRSRLSNGHEWLARTLGQSPPLYQARQCLSLDRGHGQSAAVRRSLCEPELAHHPR